MSNTAELSARLFQPSPKVAARLLREQLRDYCDSRGANYLDTEEIFQKTRSALTHLCNHATFAGPLDDQVKELVRLARELTHRPDASELWSIRQLAKVERATDDLEHHFLNSRRQYDEVTLEEVELFITVADGLRDRYLQGSYEPADAVDPTIYAQALLIAANYEAYDKTLNER